MQRVGLQPARYIQAAAYRTISRYRDMKRHDISISLLGYDMITSLDLGLEEKVLVLVLTKKSRYFQDLDVNDNTNLIISNTTLF